MGFTVAARANNRRVNQCNIAPIAGSNSEAEAEAVMQDFARQIRSCQSLYTEEWVQGSASFLESLSAGSTLSNL